MYKSDKTIRYKKLMIIFASPLKEVKPPRLFVHSGPLDHFMGQLEAMEIPEIEEEVPPSILKVYKINRRGNVKWRTVMELPWFDYNEYTDMEIVERVKMLILFS